MARPKTTGNGRLRKLECPADGMIAYVSRGAVIRHGLPFCGCGQRMFFDDLEDMFAAVPQQAHEHPDFAAFTEREIRSAQRAGANSVLVPNRLRCGGCNAWVPRRIIGARADSITTFAAIAITGVGWRARLALPLPCPF
jgi:hypothetical protein